MVQRVLSIGLFLILAALLTACDQTPAYPKREPPKGLLDNPANQAGGKILFREHCVSCHGTMEEGRSPMAAHLVPRAPDFTTPHYASAPPAYLFWRISKGKTVEPYLSRGSAMPAWGPYLSDEEIWQLVAFIRARAEGKS